MFLALLVCQFALAAANPFHKYPYVFLLDIGNEELQKTSTEQIRVSVPGSSLALRYPAIGEGDTISHVRVSGIDFGTDLKANILDGGPGSRYVVLVFMGNPGVPYDAVVTIQSISDSDINNISQANVADSISNTIEDTNDSEVKEDINNEETNKIDVANDSSEDLNDDLENDDIGDNKSEVTQESSNVHTYVKSGSEYESQKIDKDHDEIEDAIKKTSLNKQDKYLSDYDDESDDNEQSIDEQTGDTDESNLEESQDFEGGDDNESVRVEKVNSYDQYAPLKPMYNGVRFYPQMRVPFVLSQNARYNPEDEDEDNEVFSNKDNRSQSENVKDSNNNNFDSDDSSAIAI